MYQVSEGLKSEKYLGHVIVFLKEKGQQAADIHAKADQYLTVPFL